MLGKYIQVIMYLEYLDFGIEKTWHCCTERMFADILNLYFVGL